MVIYRSLVKAAAVVIALAPADWQFFPVPAFAMPTRLECTLTSAGAEGKETTRKISIVFDAQANTLDLRGVSTQGTGEGDYQHHFDRWLHRRHQYRYR